jgi:LCP family protein required for cell wall assembly
MTDNNEAPPAPARRRRRWLRWTAIGVAALVLVVVAAVVADYFYLNGKITKVPLVLPSGETAPPKLVASAENFLLMGSDSRSGAGDAKYGAEVTGARSDTTILLHIAAGGKGATLVSIPRDSWVQIPSCVIDKQGDTSQPEMNKFNAAFSIGGQDDPQLAASCTVHTVEALTGIRIDHYAVIDFNGFVDAVNALGGVSMCVAQPLDDPIVHGPDGWHGSGLKLPAGPNVQIDGTQALALMRARYNLDGGGDLPRIKRQQEFMGAMIRKATSTSLLINPIRLQSFLSTVAGSLQTDGFGLGTMRELAGALHQVGAGGVRLLTVPNLATAPGLPYGDVEWDPAKAPELWNAIKHDEPVPHFHKSAAAPTQGTVNAAKPGCLS